MLTALSYDDILLVPRFSDVVSRKDVDVTSGFLAERIFPVISANMDTVTGSEMAKAMSNYGARGCLHRFQSIEDNVKMFKESGFRTYVSVGIGNQELERFEALTNAGATHVILDVAHGASQAVVNQVKKIRELDNNVRLIVGNFATSREIIEFEHRGKASYVDAYKCGVGAGSSCITRLVTGCGFPTFSSLIDCVSHGRPIIADGGMRNSGDICKALGAGAVAVMLGGMLAGTDETPGEIVGAMGNSMKDVSEPYMDRYKMGGDMIYKKYRGSASQESYADQNKDESWRSAEGESFLVPYKGSVTRVLQQIEGGLRSSMSYMGASNLKEFHKNAEFVSITNAGIIESKAHGKI